MTVSDTTVVIPTRNRAVFLKQAVNSALGQEGGRPAIVVVDDGSSPPVGELAGARVVRIEVSRGAAAARNRGLADVTTEWVAFLDDDDLWAPDKLRRQHALLTANPGAEWSYTGALVVDEQLAVLGAQRAQVSGSVEINLLSENMVAGGGSTVLARTQLVRAVGGFNEQLPSAEDWELWVRLAAASKVVALDAPLAAWREHPTSKSHHWKESGISKVETLLTARAAHFGIAFEHKYRRQLEIDRLVASGGRRAAAGAYLSRSRNGRIPRDVLAALAVGASPTGFIAVRRWARRRAVPTSWRRDARWLEGLASSPDHEAARLHGHGT